MKKSCKIVKFDIYPIATHTKIEVYRLYDLKEGFIKDDTNSYLLEYTSPKNAYIGAKHLGYGRVYGLTAKDKEGFRSKSVKEAVSIAKSLNTTKKVLASMVFEG